jgi:dolichol-phosphate mannosyltransferase
MTAPELHLAPDAPDTPAAPATLPFFSVVLPVHNEEGNLDELHRRLTSTLAGMGRPYELVFVDDGSRDRSVEILRARSDAHTRVLVFSRNFGHHLALTAGIDAARGEVVVLMDSDLQDRPEEIPNLFAKLEEGWDVVYAVRKTKKHSLFKRLTSMAFTSLMNRLTEGLTIDTAIFRMARRPVVDAVRRCREQSRFLLGLFSWVGFRQTGVEVTHDARFAGETKYSLRRMVKLALNSLTAFSHVPLRLATYLGFMASTSSFLYAVYLVLKKILFDTAVIGWTSLMVVALFLGGVQLLCIGILGEYVGRIYGESQSRPLYVVREELGDGRR